MSPATAQRLREILERSTPQGEAAPWPDLDEHLINHLTDLYPPRCYTARGETLEDHLIYAGKVELVADLRDRFVEQEATKMAPVDVDGSEDVSVEVQH